MRSRKCFNPPATSKNLTADVTGDFGLLGVRQDAASLLFELAFAIGGNKCRHLIEKKAQVPERMEADREMPGARRSALRPQPFSAGSGSALLVGV